MAKRPGVSATFRIIAVKDQHRLLYIKHNAIATFIFASHLCFTHFFYYKGWFDKIQVRIPLFIQMVNNLIKKT